MQADVVSARVERARELTKSLTKQGIRAVALTNVDNSGITLVKTVPVSRLERAAQFGIGLSPIFDVHLVNDDFTSSSDLGGPVGERPARTARRSRLDGVPGADDRARSGLHGGAADR